MSFLRENDPVIVENESEEGEEENELPRDSLTLVELKKIIYNVNEQKTVKYDFEYKDRDDLENELEEWYDYDDVAIIQGKKVFETFFCKEWINSKIKEKKEFICHQLEELDSKDPKIRTKSCFILFYISQGNYGETKNQQDQIYWILENNKILNECNALKILYDSIRKSVNLLNTYKPMIYEKINTFELDSITLLKVELNCKMTSFYFLLETFCSDLEFRKNVVDLSPPIISWMIEEIANLKINLSIWRLYFPIIQTIQILQKLILCVFGNTKDFSNLKRYLRMLSGLPPELNKKEIIATPLDYHIFRQNIISKYPTYEPPSTLLNIDLEYTTLLPIHKGETETKKMHKDSDSSVTEHYVTPLSSPYFSLKTKQSVFKKNQDLPFLLPLSDSFDLEIPTSIKEASELFKSKTHIDLSTIQLWEETEKFMRFERGWIKDNLDLTKESPSLDIQNDPLHDSRLNAIEVIYASLVSHLESFIYVMMKFLDFLIDDEQNYTKKDTEESKKENNNFDFFSPEKILHIRKREIASKSISSTLLLLLKSFKLSHVLKFEFLSQLILDSGYIDIFNKLCSLYDPVESISHISEIPYLSYFNTCNMQSRNSNKYSEIISDFSKDIKANDLENKETDNNIIIQFSRRNLFSLVNHLRILQKITKKKTYRNLVLIQKKTWTHLQKITKITNDIVQLYTLKIFKGQIPYYNKKWKQNNMKIITSIYLHCRPELQDDWVSGVEVDTNTEESLEYALRSLIRFYNYHHYSFPNQFK
ncbi:hypothetical protein PNEG_01161 [Pneumocystis murina B123]|uniref:Far11/STRP C-terminal domain-containing protein n=1 Tax=Pneumocystis murina (strain B123) TaxID=1069680 RepID=M7NT42_PNEMU|nr:hypothetical protein PNEG_01161 [Pneumocystis murina B123]EMR10447.1 hypothetical protein PNEG_01161 [Pneumocystis murina B123]